MDALFKEITSILTKLIQLNEKTEKVYFFISGNKNDDLPDKLEKL